MHQLRRDERVGVEEAQGSARASRRPRQHRITHWLLKHHAHERGGPSLWVYDKQTGSLSQTPTSEFLAPRGEHSDEIEKRLNKIEAPAAMAARNLLTMSEAHRSGFIRVAGESDPDEEVIAPTRESGVVEEFRLTVVDGQTRRLEPDARSSLGTFVALMYARSPKVQDAMREMASAYAEGLRTGAAPLSGRMPRRLADELENAEERVRWVGLDEAPALGERLAGAQWYLLKAAEGEAFLIGDSAVTTTLAVGHDDVWRPLFDEETYGVILPLSPWLALIIAPKLMLPGAGPTWEPVKTMAMLSWKWAERYVAGFSRNALEAVAASVEAAGWGDSAPIKSDPAAVRQRGTDFVAPYVAAEMTLAAARSRRASKRRRLR